MSGHMRMFSSLRRSLFQQGVAFHGTTRTTAAFLRHGTNHPLGVVVVRTPSTLIRRTLVSHSRPTAQDDKVGHSGPSTPTNHHHHHHDSRVIYARNPARRFYARCLLGACTVHATYWAWYVLDFTPAVNASTFAPVQLDPTIGYVGWVLSVLMLGGASLYPKYLIGEIAVLPPRNEKVIKCHTFPLVRLERHGTHVVDNHTTTKIRMDAGDEQRKLLAEEGTFPRGHVAVEMEGMRGNFLLDVKEEQGEVLDKKDLVAFLMGWKLNPADIRNRGPSSKLSSSKKKKQGTHATADDTERRLRQQKRMVKRRGRF